MLVTKHTHSIQSRNGPHMALRYTRATRGALPSTHAIGEGYEADIDICTMLAGCRIVLPERRLYGDEPGNSQRLHTLRTCIEPLPHYRPRQSACRATKCSTACDGGYDADAE